MSRPSRLIYEFGPFVLDPAECVVLEGELRLAIPPRVFDTLRVLVENSGRLVEKDALMQAVWPDTAVEENNLTQAISMARKVLRDGEDGKRYIETVPKRGYRFAARVHVRTAQETQEELAEAGEKQTEPSANPESAGNVNPPAAEEDAGEAFHGKRLFRGLLWAGAGIAALGGALFLARMQEKPVRSVAREDSRQIQSIAVLPLQDLSHDPGQDYFADGMTEELITDLAQVRELKVVSKTSIMQYKDTRKPLSQIGRELGVDAVIEGSVRRSGNHVRITAQLINANTDRHIWASTYEADLKDVLNVQANVAEAITSAVRLNLDPEERRRFETREPVDAEAFDDYLRGEYHLARRNDEGYEQAISYFNRAHEKDPNFAPPYAGLADCYTLLALNDYSPWNRARAREAAEKALGLDDNLAEAHTSLAAIDVLDWNWKGARQEFERAIVLNPNYAPAYHWYGNLYFDLLGRHEEAIGQLRKAHDLDPLSLIINTDLGLAYEMAGDEATAMNLYQSVLRMDPGFEPVHFRLASYYEHKGMYDAWLKEFRSEPDVSEEFQRAYVKGGYRAIQEEASRWGDLRHIHSTPVRGATSARAYCNLGNKEKALADLEYAYQHHDIVLVFLNVDHAWDPLRSDPRFQALEQKIGLIQPQ